MSHAGTHGGWPDRAADTGTGAIPAEEAVRELVRAREAMLAERKRAQQRL